MTSHQYGISALVPQTSFGGETSGSVALNVGCFLRLKRLSKCSLRNWWGKSRGVLNDVLYREAPPKTLLYVLNTIFYTLTNGSSFHIPSLELCIHLNCCKWTVCKIWIYPAKPESVLLFTDRNDSFPTLSYTSTSEISKFIHAHVPEPWRSLPVGSKLPLWDLTMVHVTVFKIQIKIQRSSIKRLKPSRN